MRGYVKQVARKSTASISTENSFCDALYIKVPQNEAGKFNLSLAGTWTATVHLQRSFDGSTWLDVASYTSNIEDYGQDAELGAQYRFGVKTGGWSAGTITGRLSF